MKPLTIDFPDQDAPRMIAALREQSIAARALALSCEQLANDIEAQMNDRNADKTEDAQ